MVHPGRGRRLLFTTLACTVLMISGCSSSNSQKVEPGAPTVEVGDDGTWELINAAEITPESTTLRLGVTRVGCASGKTGTVLEPQVQIEAERIVIRTLVEPNPEGGSCPSNNVVPVTVELEEPVGDRELFDAF